MKVCFTYNGFHGFSKHTMVFPNKSPGDIVRLTPAQIRKHRICFSHDCTCGEGIGYWDGPEITLFCIPENGAIIKGSYPQSI